MVLANPTHTHTTLCGQNTPHMQIAGLSVLHGRAQWRNTQIHTAKYSYTYTCKAVWTKHSPHAHSRTQRTPWQSSEAQYPITHSQIHLRMRGCTGKALATCTQQDSANAMAELMAQ